MTCDHEIVIEEIYGYIKIAHTPMGEEIKEVIPEAGGVRYKCVICGDEVWPDKNNKFRTLTYKIEITKNDKTSWVHVKHLRDIIKILKDKGIEDAEEKQFSIISSLIRFGNYKEVGLSVRVVGEYGGYQRR